MRLSILDLTGHPLPLMRGLPRVGTQIADWVAPVLPKAALSIVDVEAGGDPLPTVGDFDGLLISGSEHGVYDDRPWNQPLRDLLLDTKAAGKPIYGICFGHQIMADTFGGKAEKAAVGNVVGARAFDFGDRILNAYVWHKDQVTRVPPKAKVTATAPHCPVGALEYDFPAASVQFHPEFTECFLRDIFKRGAGRDGFLTETEAQDALRSFETALVNADIVAVEVAAFFQKHCL